MITTSRAIRPLFFVAAFQTRIDKGRRRGWHALDQTVKNTELLSGPGWAALEK